MSKTKKATKKTADKKTAKKTAKSIIQAVKSAFDRIPAKIANAVVNAFASLNSSELTNHLNDYIQGYKTAKVYIKSFDISSLFTLSLEDFKKEVNALSSKTLQNLTGAIIVSMLFCNRFDKQTSTAMQALLSEITGSTIQNLKKRKWGFAGSMLHFGIHSQCKYHTHKEVAPDKSGKLFDTVAESFLGLHPLFIKTKKVYTGSDNGYYMPIPANAIHYSKLSNMGEDKIKFIFSLFISKCLNDSDRELISKKEIA